MGVVVATVLKNLPSKTESEQQESRKDIPIPLRAMSQPLADLTVIQEKTKLAE